MKKAFVIGDPIDHSLSPALHNFWLQEMGIDGSYEAINCPERYLHKTINKLLKEGYVGGNVTIPHKEKAMMLCDELDEVAKKVGAVNTLVFDGGKILGKNTDVKGFLDNVSRETFDFSQKKALVIGAGGAARAVIVALKQAGAEIIITNRTRKRAEMLAQEYDCEVLDWEKKNELSTFSILVNTTSLGMEGADNLEIDLSLLPKESLVTDIVYNPLRTSLLEQADKLGIKTVTGIGMLIYQAAPGFKAWFGREPNISHEIFQFLEKELEPQKWVQQS